MYGLGKKRSKLGAFLDREGITQEWLVKASGLSRDAVSRLCDGNKDPEKLQVRSKSKVISALRKNGYDVISDDFWS
ncbi:helix-turn-helix domain-containing protein [Paenibacillus lautus]|uniref:helix-turn-helix domain-containing protein n=1 Tax=Paenibacillus lautus TaxID=1401 RepID=UPI00384D7D54